MIEFTNTHCIRQLMHSVQALAQPADVQLSLFPDFVCKADELALDFDQSWSCVRSNDGERLTSEQSRTLQEIDLKLSQMSESEDPDIWTENALRENAQWEYIRNLARTALLAFNWPNDAPPNENIYVHSR